MVQEKNNISAKGIIKDILSLPLPEKTDVAEEFSQAGKLAGNGNGMQFFGADCLHLSISTCGEINPYCCNCIFKKSDINCKFPPAP